MVKSLYGADKRANANSSSVLTRPCSGTCLINPDLWEGTDDLHALSFLFWSYLCLPVTSVLPRGKALVSVTSIQTWKLWDMIYGKNFSTSPLAPSSSPYRTGTSHTSKVGFECRENVHLYFPFKHLVLKKRGCTSLSRSFQNLKLTMRICWLGSRDSSHREGEIFTMYYQRRRRLSQLCRVPWTSGRTDKGGRKSLWQP